MSTFAICLNMLFNDYFIFSFQRVMQENVGSEWSPVTSGAPQRSTLVAFLLAVFTNTLLKSLSLRSIGALFTDD